MKRMRGGILYLLAIGLVGCVGAVASDISKKGELAVTECDVDYGFRYDPTTFVEISPTLDAALVRRDLKREPLPGDAGLIQVKIDEALGRLRTTLQGEIKSTCGRVLELIELGVDPACQEIQDAIKVMEAEKCDEHGDNLGHISVRGVRALCLLGQTDAPLLEASLENILSRQEVWNSPRRLCPWGQALYLQALWDGRHLVDTTAVVQHVLGWMADGLNDASCISYKDPWAHLDAASRIDDPNASRMVKKSLPMILRAQQADGGWGGHSRTVFRALTANGLLASLKALPPQPSDWQVVRSVPSPSTNVADLVWADGTLWTMDRKGGTLFGIADSDGTVKTRIDLSAVGKEAVVVGLLDGSIAVVFNDDKTKRIVRFDPDSGNEQDERQTHAKLQWPASFFELDGELWFADTWYGNMVHASVDGKGELKHQMLAGPSPNHIARSGDTIWHVDGFVPLLIRTSFHGELLDWGEQPFSGRCAGVAWDGKDLWALDPVEQRICVIRKTPEGAANAKGFKSVAIADVPPLSWQKSGGTTFAGALVSALAVTDHPYSYSDIMGYSALAFRVRWGPRERGWCPSVPVGEFPEERDLVSRLTGWQFKNISEMDNEADPRMERYSDDLAASLDRGMPVVGYADRKDLNCAAAYGYEQAGGQRTFLWHNYWGAEGNRVVEHEVGPWVLMPERFTDPGTEQSRLIEVLKIMVAHWEREAKPTQDAYYYLYGRHALEAWIADIESVDGLDTQKRQSLFFANWWCYSTLADARSSAAKFLHAHSVAFEGEAGKALRHAAAIYEKQAALLGRPLQAKDSFLGPWSGKKIDDWSEAVRKREIDLLGQTMTLEAQAIAAIKKVPGVMP